MNVMSAREIEAWCQTKGIDASKHELTFESPSNLKFSIKLPKAAPELTALAYSLLNVNPQSNFQGALLWIRDWAMGSSDLDQSGIAILQQMRRGHRQEKTLIEAPGHLFLDDEWLQLYSFVMIPLWYQWDALLIGSSGSNILSMSHDGNLQISFKERSWHDSTKKSLEGWNPK